MDNYNKRSNFLLPSLEKKIEELSTNLRLGQNQLAQWQKGKMAVSAVPGAGKSYSLAIASALTIAKNQLNHHRQLIIVTYTRSAAASIQGKIKENLEKLQLPVTGFMTQTLHGLARYIASLHPEICPINLEHSTLIIPTPSHEIIRKSVETWIKLNPYHYQMLLEGQTDFEGDDSEKLRRQSVLRTEILPSLAHTVIREAKSSGLSPEEIWGFQDYSSDQYELMAIAGGLYEQYQLLMKQENYIDYDDLILASLKVLERPDIRKSWQEKVFAVFEDEAQDSSPLQEELITILASNDTQPDIAPNLIRVGDPNQAINSTFTPADPTYFNWFCDDCQENGQLATMAQAGRSSKIIIEVANQTLKWVNEQIQSVIVKNKIELPENQSLFREQDIELVEQNQDNFSEDINPEAEGKGVEIYQPEDIFETVKLIGERIIKLFANEEDRKKYNLAILVRENNQGKFLEKELQFLKSEHNLILKFINDQENYAHIPKLILALLKFIDRPHSADNLKNALVTLQNLALIEELDLNKLSIYPENFLYPNPLEPEKSSQEKQAQNYCLQLLKARLELPHYQLMIWLGIFLNFSGSDLATLHKLSERINQEIVGRSTLKAIIFSLENLIKAEKFEGVEAEEGEEEEIYTKKGQVTIITMHKAKGLEWDYVFLPFLHQKNIPGEPYIPEQNKFLGDFNLSEVSRAMIRSAIYQTKREDSINKLPSIKNAWEIANCLKQAEEYRLLYVAMTRAKKLLWMSAARKAPFLWRFADNYTHPPSLQNMSPCPVISLML